VTIFLLFIPILALVSAVYVYKDTGKRNFLRMDLVQFFYAFILSPLVFVWGKSFLFFLLKNEVNVSLSTLDIFIFDTIFSILAFYVFSFVVVHSITKTFELQTKKDPLYNVFEHSEYYHLWLSHLVIYAGIMLFATALSLINVFIPLQIFLNKFYFHLSLLFSSMSGVLAFAALWFYETEDANFMRLMKLLMGVILIIHFAIYFIFDPQFNSQFIFYWAMFVLFLTAVVVAVFAERPEKKSKIMALPFTINIYKPKYYLKFLTKKLERFKL